MFNLFNDPAIINIPKYLRWLLAKFISKRRTKTAQEIYKKLGGKSPTIIFPDADVDAAIAGAASAIFFNHGQCCCAGSRLMAHEKIFHQLLY